MNEQPAMPPRGGFWQLLGVVTEERHDGYGRVRLPVTPDLLRGGEGQPLHGGVYMTVADMACVLAARSALREGERLGGTAEMSISFLRPVFSGAVIGEARVLKKGRMLVVCDADVSDDQGRLVAKARASFAVLAPDPT